MSYQLYDINNNRISHRDLQDKSAWCKTGESIEESFVRGFGDKLKVSINPEKTANKYAPDLIIKNKYIADLKTQNTPFFMAKEKFNLDPAYTVVFNQKDRERYAEMYPEIYILFWVDWKAVKMVKGNSQYTCNPLKGVWATTFQRLDKICKASSLHQYTQRRNDTIGNARSSYVIDLNLLKRIV